MSGPCHTMAFLPRMIYSMQLMRAIRISANGQRRIANLGCFLSMSSCHIPPPPPLPPPLPFHPNTHTHTSLCFLVFRPTSKGRRGGCAIPVLQRPAQPGSHLRPFRRVKGQPQMPPAPPVDTRIIICCLSRFRLRGQPAISSHPPTLGCSAVTSTYVSGNFGPLFDL